MTEPNVPNDMSLFRQRRTPKSGEMPPEELFDAVLDGKPLPDDASPETLAVAALLSSAREITPTDEVRGLDQARAAFVAAYPEGATSGLRLSAKVIGSVVVAFFATSTAAAYAGMLPATVQDFAHHTIGAPSAEQSTSTDDGPGVSTTNQWERLATNPALNGIVASLMPPRVAADLPNRGGQVNPADPNGPKIVPPGNAYGLTKDKTVPPGQEKKSANASTPKVVPPGQIKKSAAATVPPKVPPGQVKKSATPKPSKTPKGNANGKGN